MKYDVDEILSGPVVDGTEIENKFIYDLRMGAIKKFKGVISDAADFLRMRRSTLSMWVAEKGHRNEVNSLRPKRIPGAKRIRKPKPEPRGLAKIYPY